MKNFEQNINKKKKIFIIEFYAKKYYIIQQIKNFKRYINK